MAEKISFDTTEVTALAAKIATAPQSARAKIPAVLGRGATNIRNQMRSETKGSTYFDLGSTITRSRMKETPTTFEVEIGPERRFRQARLAHIGYFGGAHGGGGTLPDPEGALQTEAPAVMRYLAQLAADAV
jgi:hypothetical protein